MQTLSSIIDTAIQGDMGNCYKQELRKAVVEIEDAYRPTTNGLREHLGASAIVKECKRAVWYSFTWVHGNSFDGRMLRLFNRGHLEEARFIAMLRSIDLEVYTVNEQKRQYGFVHGYYRGSCDGIIGYMEEGEKRYCMVEFKTHNDSSFGTLQARGIKNAKPEHYDQMQILMYMLGLNQCIYLAVNKNDDTLFTDVITVAPEVGARYLDMAQEIITMYTPPPPLDPSPTFWKCKMCNYLRLCKFNEKTNVLQNCRTCAYGIFKDIQTFECAHGFIRPAGACCNKYQQKDIL